MYPYAGADTVTIDSGVTVTGTICMAQHHGTYGCVVESSSTEIDTLINNGTIGFVGLGYGADILDNNGTMTSGIYF